MKYHIFLLLAVLALCLSGCAVDSNELLHLPQLPEQYMLVQAQLDKILSDQTQLSAPVSGENRSAIQMADLNGDSLDEVIAFCKTTKNDKVVLQLYIFRLERGQYTQYAVLEGVGDSYDCCAIARMGLENIPVLVVGWRLGANPVCGLSAYRCGDKGMELLYSGEYTGLVVDDIDADERDELLVLRHMAAANQPGTATLLGYESGRISVAGSASLSAAVASPSKLSFDSIGGGKSGVVVDGYVDEKHIVTDVLCFLEGNLVNLTYDELTMCSTATLRPAAYASTDVDGDGALEIPVMAAAPGSGAHNVNPMMFCHWYGYQEQSGLTRKFSGYWEPALKWLMLIPDTLLPGITVTRGMNEMECDSVVFREYDGETEINGSPLWEIYYIDGPMRFQRTEELMLTELARTTEAVYAVKLETVSDQNIISLQELASLFSLVG